MEPLPSPRQSPPQGPATQQEREPAAPVPGSPGLVLSAWQQPARWSATGEAPARSERRLRAARRRWALPKRSQAGARPPPRSPPARPPPQRHAQQKGWVAGQGGVPRTRKAPSEEPVRPRRCGWWRRASPFASHSVIAKLTGIINRPWRKTGFLPFQAANVPPCIGSSALTEDCRRKFATVGLSQRRAWDRTAQTPRSVSSLTASSTASTSDA